MPSTARWFGPLSLSLVLISLSLSLVTMVQLVNGILLSLCTLAMLTSTEQVLKNGKLLAVGDEEGIVSILDTSKPMPSALSRGKADAQWLGHQNAIFGLHWYQASL